MTVNPNMDRRRFLVGGLTLAGAASLMGGLAPRAAARGLNRPDNSGSRRLVLLQLSGGNDGVSTIVPHGDDAYHASRRSTRILSNEVLPIDKYRGFHPELGRFRRIYDAGRLAIVEGVGYPDPTLSHFKCLEVWHTARRAGRASGEGWISRLVDTAWAGAPSTERVVNFGSQVPYSVYSTRHPAISLKSPSAYQFLGTEAEADAWSAAGRAQGKETSGALGRLRRILRDAEDTSARIRSASAAYRTPVDYPDTPLAHTLKDVAALIASPMETRIFSTTYAGFDTHSGQRGVHNALMSTLDGALGAFVQDLARSEAGRDTVVLVFSEFGRRLKENGSNGHDHGKAGPMFVLGERVKGGLYGKHPSLTRLDHGDPAFTTDFRSVYATLIKDWFGTDDATVLGNKYPGLGFLRA
jgi:uncharacterized protein (DUF1501 family)